MLKDIWDELWRESVIQRILHDDETPWDPELFVWLDKMKAEGDKLKEKAEKYDEHREYLTRVNKHLKDIDAIGELLSEVCEDYNTEFCQEGICDCDPNGWEGCLTRKTLDALGEKHER